MKPLHALTPWCARQALLAAWMLRLLWLGAGLAEASVHQANKASHEALEKAGITHVFFDCPFAHEWQTWRYDLRDFAPRLFR